MPLCASHGKVQAPSRPLGLSEASCGQSPGWDRVAPARRGQGAVRAGLCCVPLRALAGKMHSTEEGSALAGASFQRPYKASPVASASLMRKLRWAPNASQTPRAGQRRSWDVKPTLGRSKALCARVAPGWIFMEGLHRSDRSRARKRGLGKGRRERRLPGALLHLVLSRPRPDSGPTAQDTQPWVCRGVSVGPEPDPVGLSLGLSSPAESQQALFVPSPRKSSRKGTWSQRRPSVTCSWAASRTRRPASGTPCRSVPPGCSSCLLLPRLLPLHVPVLGTNDDSGCIS